MNSGKYLFISLIILYLQPYIKVFGQENLKEMVIQNAVIAHRGMPRHAPEETIMSYKIAKALGVDYMEADLQLTKDNIIVCIHDANLKRTTNIEDIYPARANDPVSSFTLAELQKLDAGSWFNSKYPDRARNAYKGAKIITLDQLIDIAEEGSQTTGLYLETKKPELFPGIEKRLHDQLESRGWINSQDKKLILQTFSTNSLQLLNKYFPETPKCMLLWKGDEYLKGGLNQETLKKALTFAKSNGADIVGPSFKGSKNIYFNLMKDRMVETYHNMGFIIHPYTFDTEKDQERYVPLSDGQFTNRSDLLLDYYKRPHPSVDDIIQKLGY